MARLTRHDAAVKAADLQRSIARLRQLANDQDKLTKPTRDARLRQRKAGRDHELAHMEALAWELVNGLRAQHDVPELSGTRDTSAAALAAALPKASGQRQLVLQRFALWRHQEGHGWTDVQLAEHTRLSPNTVRPRRGELVAQGWLEDSGKRREHNGRDHIVWRLTEAGRMRLQTGDTEQ